MKSNEIAKSEQPFFVDHMNVLGKTKNKPTWDDFLSLESQLKAGTILSFSLERQSDRDAALEVEISEGGFAIMGMEDSNERGLFGFCFVDPNKTSKLIIVAGNYYPEYCTTNNANTVIDIARTYFQTGELDRSVTWHVARKGMGRRLEDIPPSEILPANDHRETLKTMLTRL